MTNSFRPSSHGTLSRSKPAQEEPEWKKTEKKCMKIKRKKLQGCDKLSWIIGFNKLAEPFKLQRGKKRDGGKERGKDGGEISLNKLEGNKMNPADLLVEKRRQSVAEEKEALNVAVYSETDGWGGEGRRGGGDQWCLGEMEVINVAGVFIQTATVLTTSRLRVRLPGARGLCLCPKCSARVSCKILQLIPTLPKLSRGQLETQNSPKG